MRQLKHCIECGSPLGTGVPGLLCVTCALQGALQVVQIGGPPPVTGVSFELELNGFSSRPVGAPEGTLFGNYELLHEVAQGGMGVVYKARQTALNRLVALKTIRGERLARPETVRRFQQEAAAAARLHHPHIVAIHEAGQVDGQHLYSMDFVEGHSLAEVVREHPLPARRAARYVMLIAGAIHYAHEQGILHRDLKPSNILIDTNDSPRVTDFGLAKVLQTESEMTLTGEVIGSPSYMAPEQASGRSREIDPRTDVYALGAILYELVTGRPPFRAETTLQTLKLVTDNEPVPPRLFNPGLPEDLETICLRCLEKEPERRYPSAHLIAAELSRFLEGKPVLARPVGALNKSWRWCRRNPTVASLTLLLLLAVVGGFCAVVQELHRARVAELIALKNAYVSDTNLARQALEESNLGRARALLERYRPDGHRSSPIRDLRGWEWRWLWRRCQTQERATLTGAAERVGRVALSADGRWLAALGRQESIWDLSGQRLVATRPDKTWYSGNQILFAPDGRTLFVGHYEDACVRMLAVPSLESRGQLRHQYPVNWIALSGDGRLLAAEDMKAVKIWDAVEGRELSSISTEYNLRYGRVALSRDGYRLAFSDFDGRIYVWNWTNRQQVAKLAGHARVPPWQCAIHDLAFSPDGRQLLSTGPDRAVRLWDLESGREVRRLEAHSRAVAALAYSPDGSLLATAGFDQTIRLWDVATWQVRATLHGHLDEVWSVAFSADGRTLATGSKDETVKPWDAQTVSQRELSWAVPLGTRAILLGPDAGVIGVLGADGAFRLLTTTNWQASVAHPVRVGPTDTPPVAMDRGATCLVAGTAAGPIRRWRLPEPSEAVPFIGHTGRVDALAFSDDGRWLASTGADNILRVWRTDTGRQAAEFPYQHQLVFSIIVSPNANWLGVIFDNDELQIWERRTGRRVARLNPHKTGFQMVFLNHRPGFATAGADGLVKIWDLQTLRCEEIFRDSLHGVTSIAITPNDDRLACGTGEGVIRIWNLELGQEMATLKGHRESVGLLAFSRDERILVGVSPDKVSLWEAPSLAEIEAAETVNASPQRLTTR